MALSESVCLQVSVGVRVFLCERVSVCVLVCLSMLSVCVLMLV